MRQLSCTILFLGLLLSLLVPAVCGSPRLSLCPLRPRGHSRLIVSPPLAPPYLLLTVAYTKQQHLSFGLQLNDFYAIVRYLPHSRKWHRAVLKLRVMHQRDRFFPPVPYPYTCSPRSKALAASALWFRPCRHVISVSSVPITGPITSIDAIHLRHCFPCFPVFSHIQTEG